MNGQANKSLRVALIAGALSRGGAEKQAVYMARALHEGGVDVRIYNFREEGLHEPDLTARGIPHRLVRCPATPPGRLLALYAEMRRFRPHIIQASLFWWNIHVSVLGYLCGAMAIGAVRSSGFREVDIYGRRGRWLLHIPPSLITNSDAARRNLEALGVTPAKIAVLPNAIDLNDFDARSAVRHDDDGRDIAVAVGRLIPVKRFDRFLESLARARCTTPALAGMIIGDGPEGSALLRQAEELGLLSGGLTFLGARDDIPALLGRAAMLVLSSDTEGFPNVLLEAMAARRPVITTPAGDAGLIVEEGRTGYVVPFGDTDTMAERMVRLANAPGLRQKLGEAGRERVERLYNLDSLFDQLLAIYRDIARRRGCRDVLHLLARWASPQRSPLLNGIE